VAIGGINAPVIFAGPAPSFAGLNLFNGEIPANAFGAIVRVSLKIIVANDLAQDYTLGCSFVNILQAMV